MWFLYFAALVANVAAFIPKLVSEFEISHPGFITLVSNRTSGKQTFDIIVSQFNGIPFSTDYVSLVRDIGNPKSWTAAHVESLSSKLHWPNEPNSVPENVFKRGNLVVIPSGFLVPTKGSGALTVLDLNNGAAYPMTANNDGEWFYHRVIWIDMDGDGLEDIVTCRAHKPFFGNVNGEMVWLKQPNVSEAWKETWTETVLSDGKGAPDTFLIPVTIGETDDRIQGLITAGFFSQSLDLWWRKDESRPWTKENINKRVLDNSEGDTFDLIYADINNDKVNDLLVSYNKPSNGTLIVYEISGDLRSSSVKKTLILGGIDPAKSGVGKGAPGSMKLTWPDLRNKTARPDIILSGDDNGKLFLLRTNNKGGWKYNVSVLINSSPGTLGAIAVGDIDGDHHPEIISPSYNDNKISILTYNQSAVEIEPQVSTTEMPSTKATSVFHHIKSWFKSIFG